MVGDCCIQRRTALCVYKLWRGLAAATAAVAVKKEASSVVV